MEAVDGGGTGADPTAGGQKERTPRPLAEAVQPVEHETIDRVITGLVTVVPFLLLGLAAWQLWNQALHWHDLTIFALIYLPTGLGITVGSPTAASRPARRCAGCLPRWARPRSRAR
jgi:hypothetical protein